MNSRFEADKPIEANYPSADLLETDSRKKRNRNINGKRKSETVFAKSGRRAESFVDAVFLATEGRK